MRHRARSLAVFLAFAAACGDDGSSATDGATPPGRDGARSGGDAGETDAGPPPYECPDATPTSGFFVSPSGTSGGDGTEGDPWDLQTALDMPAAVSPGDTIWMRDGTYAGGFVSRLEGTAEARVVLRSYPGEHAVIDGAGHDDTTFQVYRSHAVYRDFEITNTDPNRTGGRRSAIWLEGEGLALVHLEIHDTGNVPMYEEAPDLELYGCLIYNVGYDDTDRGHGHNVYIQNDTGQKRVEENLIFHGFSFGVHGYAEGSSTLTNMRFVGNVLWNNGAAAAGTDTLEDNLLVGGTDMAADGIELVENLGWASPIGERSVRLGWGVPNGSVVLTDNYFAGNTIFRQPWSSVTMAGNTFVGPVTDNIDTADHPDNTYLDAAPTESRVFVRSSRWEPGRAHVVVYNWGDLDAAAVDLGDLLAPGTPFVVRHAEDYFGPPVLSAEHDGSSITLPMRGLSVAQPIGSPDAIAPSEQTGAAFNVFVVEPACP